MNFGSGGMGQVNFYGSQNAQIPKMSFPVPMPFLPNQVPLYPNLNPNNFQSPVLNETNLKTEQNENESKEPSVREKRSPKAQGNIYINFGNGGAGSSNSNYGSSGGFDYYGGGGRGSAAFNDYMSSYNYYG